MMATDTSIKKDGLCSLTAQKLSEDPQGFTGPPGIYIKFESHKTRCRRSGEFLNITYMENRKKVVLYVDQCSCLAHNNNLLYRLH